MKKIALTLLMLLAAGIVFWTVYRHGKIASPIDSKHDGSTVAPSAASGTGARAGANSNPKTAEDEENDRLEAESDAKREREVKGILEEHVRLYRTAIVFYGLVLDEAHRAVPGAKVKYENADPSGNWTWKDLNADQNGTFTIRGVQGRYLDVQVSHPEYYQVPESKRSFTYAGNDRGPDFKPNAANPEVFLLRKKGAAAELIHRISQVLFKNDEDKRSFSLVDHSRRRDRPEYVIIRSVDNGRVNSRGKHVLDLELSAPQGGLQLRTNPFQFTAPDHGYQATVVVPPSSSINPVDYFVQFESGNFGRFTIAGNSGQYDVESFLNPDKSPNLEYDPQKEITVIQNGHPGVDLLYPAKRETPPKP